MSRPGGPGGSGSTAKGTRPGADDEALVAALGRAARDCATSDSRGGPSPGVWYRLAQARAGRAAAGSTPPGSRRMPIGAIVALVGGAACLAVVGVGAFRWRQDGPSPPVAAGAGAGATTSDPAAPPLSFSVEGATVVAGATGPGPGEAGQEEQIDATGRSEAAVRFSDGTDVGLFDGARLSVRGRDAHGARLRLRGGRARFQVVHRPRASWTVEAGPYVIEVTGTVFDVRWSDADQTIEVQMESGSVRVSGPLLARRMELRTGQRLVVRSTAGEVRIEERPPTRADEAPPSAGASFASPAAPAVSGQPTSPEGMTPPGAAASAEAGGGPAGGRRRPNGPVALAMAEPRPPAARRSRASLETGSPAGEDAVGATGGRSSAAFAVRNDGAVPPTPFDPPSGLRAEGAAHDAPPAPREEAAGSVERARERWTSRQWAARVAMGESQAVLADAERIGFEATLAKADGHDLAAFADAARYAGRPDLALRALTETRRRFPGTARAAAAAFLLGRAADDRGDTAAGLSWYRRYLLDAPGGPLASEALGRQMLAVEKLRGRAAAAPFAVEYLQRFPNGTYLLRARALLDER